MGWPMLTLQNCVAEGGEEQGRGFSGDAGEGQHAAGDDYPGEAVRRRRRAPNANWVRRVRGPLRG